ncbi:MAG: GDP-mannose 4,6-dehydratase [Candidatus Odinarchaeota archaeon]|nr:GDP-mannose 4,6-dehydratase [Candidatus Odinarchaeota archaeon]
MITFKNKTIVVTGGCGFIGSHLVDKLINLGATVIVIDNLISSTTEYIERYIGKENFWFYEEDIRDFEAMCDIFSRHDIDIVFHFAADPDVKNSVEKPFLSFYINVEGTLNILEAMRKNDIDTIIFASSGGTLYGDVEEFPVTENTPPKPISPYGASKVSGEAYLSAYVGAYGFSAISLRLANIFGPRSTHGVMFDFFHKLKKNKNELLILGNGLQRKSYLYISDCIDAIMAITNHINKGFDAYNIGSEEWYTVNEIANLIVKALGLSNVKFKYTGGERGWAGDVKRILLSIDKLKSINWKPKVSFEEGVKKYVSWLKEKYGWP